MRARVEKKTKQPENRIHAPFHPPSVSTLLRAPPRPENEWKTRQPGVGKNYTRARMRRGRGRSTHATLSSFSSRFLFRPLIADACERIRGDVRYFFESRGFPFTGLKFIRLHNSLNHTRRLRGGGGNHACSRFTLSRRYPFLAPVAAPLLRGTAAHILFTKLAAALTICSGVM